MYLSFQLFIMVFIIQVGGTWSRQHLFNDIYIPTLRIVSYSYGDPATYHVIPWSQRKSSARTRTSPCTPVILLALSSLSSWKNRWKSMSCVQWTFVYPAKEGLSKTYLWWFHEILWDTGGLRHASLAVSCSRSWVCATSHHSANHLISSMHLHISSYSTTWKKVWKSAHLINHIPSEKMQMHFCWKLRRWSSHSHTHGHNPFVDTHACG